MCQWLVIEENVEMEACLTWPKYQNIWKIRDNKIYNLKTDERNRAALVVRYSIDMQTAE